jgi:hypothetical protein
MFRKILPVVLLLLITHSLPTQAARELVDDFNGSTIDFTKWSYFDSALSAAEFAAVIDTTAGNLVLTEASDGSRYQRTRVKVEDTTLTAMQATISIISADDGGGGVAAASIDGVYYNAASATPTDRGNDVYASVLIGERGNGLEAWWEIHISTDPDFDTSILASSDSIISPGILTFNTPYVVKIEYDGFTTFTFTVNGMTSGPISRVSKRGPPSYAYQRLTSSTDCCGTNPSIHATFDDVVLDNGLTIYDDFSSGIHLDSTKWVTYLGSRVTEDGKLLLDVSDDDIAIGLSESITTDLYLKDRDPDEIEAQISVSSESFLDAGLEGRAQLIGYFYNERRDGGVNALPYDGNDGDVWGFIHLALQNGVLSANAYLRSELADGDTDQELLWQSFTRPLALDNEYLVSIRREGEMLMFKLDDETIVYNILTPIYPPSPDAGDGYRRLTSRILGISNSPGTGGVFKMSVDDVFVENIDEIDSLDEDDDSDGGGGSSIAAALVLLLPPLILSLHRKRRES